MRYGLHRSGCRLALDGRVRLCVQLSHRPRVKVAHFDCRLCDSSHSTRACELSVDMNEQVMGKISDTVGLEIWHSLH